MSSEIFLKIAGIIVRMSSRSVSILNKESYHYLKGFLLKGKPKKININIEVEIKTQLPIIKDKKNICRFRPLHINIVRDKESKKRLGGKSLSWILSKKDQKFLLEGRYMEYKQEGVYVPYIAYLNKDFNCIKIIISIPTINKKDISQRCQITYKSGPLQIIFILYLMKNKLGILSHAAGIEDNGKGILFVGPTHSGKTTMARLWHGRRNVTILNDDKVVIRKIRQWVYLCGTPWGGLFNTSPKIVGLKKLFFIRHRKKINEAILLRRRDGFNNFFSRIFLPFWDKKDMDFTVDFLFNIVNRIPTYSLNFVNDRSIINYVREGKYGEGGS